MDKKSTIWKLEPHTVGKHLVLKRYLDAWLPIMGSRQGRILYIDGFSGPGKYLGGEDGSPLIAIRAYKDHSALKKIQAEVCFSFIECDKGRAEYLEHLISELKDDLPSNCRTEIINGIFFDTVTQWLDRLDTQGKYLAPAFVMIDPTGISGLPMSLNQRLLKYPRSEVFITFMYEWINRFKSTPVYERHMDLLFGCSTWRNALSIKENQRRKSFLYELYEEQLRRAGAKHVVKFELFKGNRLIYAIFFGTQHVTGCERMKQAIWKVAPWGDFIFHGNRYGQLTMGIESPDFEPLIGSLKQKFQGKGWVSVGGIERFVSSDKTDYLKSHLRKGALIPMEEAKEIEVDKLSRGRKNTYPKGTKIRFT